MRNKLFSWGRLLIERGVPLFAPVSWIWGIVVFCKNWLYDHGWLVSHRVQCTIVSIGNIVVGGTGKTPFVQRLARAFSHRRVAILSRGYGRIPDEAILLQNRLPNARIYVGKDRMALADLAVADGADLIILDDGFQYRRLYRDFDVVLINGDDPLGKGHYLPWGFLRDSPKRLKGADAVFVNGKEIFPTVVRILDFERREIENILGWKVGLFCGVGNPRSFRKTVCDLGADVVAEWILVDHEPASSDRIENFWIRCKSLGARVLVTTEKDIVKISRSPCPLIFVEIELALSEGREKWEKLIAKIDQKIDTRKSQL